MDELIDQIETQASRRCCCQCRETRPGRPLPDASGRPGVV